MKLQNVRIQFRIDEPRILKNRYDDLVRVLGNQKVYNLCYELWEVSLRNVEVRFKTVYGIPRVILDNRYQLPISVIRDMA